METILHTHAVNSLADVNLNARILWQDGTIRSQFYRNGLPNMYSP